MKSSTKRAVSNALTAMRPILEEARRAVLRDGDIFDYQDVLRELADLLREEADSPGPLWVAPLDRA